MNKGMNMKLFIINNVLSDYTYGMVAIKAESLEQAREFFVDEDSAPAGWDSEFEKEFDDAVKNKDYIVMDLADTDQSPAGFVKVMFGGS